MTECNQETFAFTVHFSRRVEAGFTAGQVSSDGGALLLREVDRRIELSGRLAACFSDGRAQWRVERPLSEVLGARIFGMALGFGYRNENDKFRSEPPLHLFVG